MSTNRMEAFSDGVIAIIITIMVLELHDPTGSHWSALRGQSTTLAIYLLSFTNIGIYWTNHHHLLRMADRVNGLILWANLSLLFWLSLLPYATRWVGSTHLARDPMIAYAVVLLASGIAYTVLELAIIADQGPGSKLATAVGNDVKGKASVAMYTLAIPAAIIDRWLALALVIAVAVMWFVPDRRIETAVATQPDEMAASDN